MTLGFLWLCLKPTAMISCSLLGLLEDSLGHGMLEHSGAVQLAANLAHRLGQSFAFQAYMQVALGPAPSPER